MVDFTEHDSRMSLTAIKFGKFLESAAAEVVVTREDRESDEDLIGVQTRVPASEVIRFRVLNRLDHILGDKFDRVINSGEVFHRIKKEGSRRAEEFAGFGGDDRSVGEFDCRGGFS